MSYDNLNTWSWKGREAGAKAQGGNHRGAKLTEDEAREIKAALARPYDHRPTKRALAEAYGVSIGAIDNIRRGRTWNHVHVEEGT